RIFVGAQALDAATLGQGSTGGFESSGLSQIANQSDFAQAVQNASAAGSANQGRGAGPIIKAINKTGPGAPYSNHHGSDVGSITFNSGINWQFDHTAAVAHNQYDLYSVAVHEILQALGFSKDQSESFTADVSSTNSQNWLGPQVIAQLGTGNNVLE